MSFNLRIALAPDEVSHNGDGEIFWNGARMSKRWRQQINTTQDSLSNPQSTPEQNKAKNKIQAWTIPHSGVCFLSISDLYPVIVCSCSQTDSNQIISLTTVLVLSPAI